MCSIVVNTCKDYFKHTVPPLLASLEAAQVPQNAIFVVVGDCEANEEHTLEGIRYIFRRYSNLDNNGLMWITQETPPYLADWVCYLHDTSLVTTDFWRNVFAIINNPTTTRAPCTRLYEHHSMGMGFYRTDWLCSPPVKQYMATLVNEDTSKRQEIKNNLDVLEDTLFTFADVCHTLENEYTVVETGRTMYGTDTPRIVEYYRLPGIYKIKANWKLPVFVKL
jgi:hypothetical protein